MDSPPMCVIVNPDYTYNMVDFQILTLNIKSL